MSVRPIILEHSIRIPAQQKKPPAPLTDNLPLLEPGPDSQCIAILVPSLDDGFGVDPSDRDGNVTFPEMRGDFVELYGHAAA